MASECGSEEVGGGGARGGEVSRGWGGGFEEEGRLLRPRGSAGVRRS